MFLFLTLAQQRNKRNKRNNCFLREVSDIIIYY